uniref:Uncharacterized protein n=1 Tax=Octopus bimaculoides TaxID=37653 RepID=A0A0L8HEV2_OCTBM
MYLVLTTEANLGKNSRLSKDLLLVSLFGSKPHIYRTGGIGLYDIHAFPRVISGKNERAATKN